MFLGRVITYCNLFVYILVLYVCLHSDFGVQSQYKSEIKLESAECEDVDVKIEEYITHELVRCVKVEKKVK